MPEKICEHCGNIFKIYPSQIGKKRFCSRECHYASRRKRIDRVCQNCGKSFEVRPSELIYNRGLFCSTTCYKEFAHGPNAPNWRGGKISRVCKFCGKEFTVSPNKIKSGKGKYCSKECWQRDHSVTLECQICGQPFTIPASHKEKTKCCSWNCRAKYLSQIRGKNHPLYNRIPKVCPVCGKTFYVQPSVEEHFTHCSKECSEKASPSVMLTCENCGKEFLVHNHRAQEAKYCSRKCHWEAKSNQVELICEMCNKPFMVGPCRAEDARFCSRECYIKYVGPTSIEQLLIDELDKQEIDYEFQYPLNSWHLDFAFPVYKLAVEADGLYWHSQPDCQERDARKDADLQSQGWTVLRFTGDEIRESPAACVDEIVKHLT